MGSGRPAKFARPLERVVHAFARADSAVSTAIRQRTGSRMDQQPDPPPCRKLSNLPFPLIALPAAGIFARTRAAYLDHEQAKTELKTLMPEDAKEAIGHGVRAKRSKSGAGGVG